jgi:hypothetical protein
MIKETLHVFKDRRGFELRKELATVEGNEPVILNSVYTQSGEYIGDIDTAIFLYTLGIKPECLPGKRVCSIGFCEKEQKWYGWSHRAYCGFGIGAVVTEGDCMALTEVDENTDFRQQPELDLPIGFKAATLEDCKRMAIAFATAVA